MSYLPVRIHCHRIAITYIRKNGWETPWQLKRILACVIEQALANFFQEWQQGISPKEKDKLLVASQLFLVTFAPFPHTPSHSCFRSYFGHDSQRLRKITPLLLNLFHAEHHRI